jgi:3-oxoacyl-[acyl-carrier protein] reductase
VRVDGSTRALVTGGSRGIGRALAQALAARGATVGRVARSESADRHAYACDVADRASVERAVADFAAAAGGLDLAVANAGIAHYGPFEELDPALAERMTAVNWLGTVNTVRTALPYLREGGGHIVIVCSAAGLRAFPDAAVYGATKAAQRGFAEALRHELAGTGVSLTTVFPGEIATSLHDHERDHLPAWYHGGGRAVAPAALAETILAAVEADRRTLYYPRSVRLLGVLHGLSPRLADAVLRRLRGESVAPRRD